ncbi:MAG: alpha/beta fold hydrolase [Micropepsaceae bacterium]
MTRYLAATLAFLCAAPAFAEPAALHPAEGDYIARDFTFTSGEKITELRLHYTTLGEPQKDAQGHVTNAVMILHGTGGDGKQFFQPQFADVLFAPGGLLDPAKHYIILPDGIGHGKSSRPSDGLHARFPHYDYDDMVRAQHQMLTEGLGVDHLKLIMGTSMGCMHAFVWGETYTSYMDAMMPLACLPNEIAGRNRMWRKMTIDAITLDPAWEGGEYKSQPMQALRTAASLLVIAGSAPLYQQATYPTRDSVDAFIDKSLPDRISKLDANDLLYQVAASRNYNPSSRLETIRARVTWVNSTDDFINPPELGIAEREAKRLKNGKFVMIQASTETRGHGTHTWAKFWQHHLAALLK